MKTNSSGSRNTIKYFVPFLVSFLILSPIFLFLNLNSQYRYIPGDDALQKLSYGSPVETIPDTVLSIIKSKIDSSAQKILLAGDSMADGLLAPLKKYCECNNHKLIQAGWTSSTIVGWGNSRRLSGLIKKHKPTLILMVLGANELFTTELDIRKKLVKKITEEAGNVKLLWVGPPNWKNDFGLDDMYKETLGAEKYFSSKSMFLSAPLKSKRGGDKKHPSGEAYKIWADSITSWIMNKSDSPVLLDKPQKN